MVKKENKNTIKTPPDQRRLTRVAPAHCRHVRIPPASYPAPELSSFPFPNHTYTYRYRLVAEMELLRGGIVVNLVFFRRKVSGKIFIDVDEPVSTFLLLASSKQDVPY